ncbi:MAG: hypothetical protein KTR32_16470 [Granulosicoccus sp.]|nr:hypothetical protein [Granulosicoccus sp.]
MKKFTYRLPWLITAFLLLALTSIGKANAAGEFEVLPTSSGKITGNPITVSWTSSAPQQWVRAFDAASGNRFFDSGRLLSGSGVLSISIPTTAAEVQIVFYEKISGAWFPQESTFPIEISGGGGGGTGAISIAGRISCEAVGIGPGLPSVMTDPGGLGTALEQGPTASCALECPAGEFLIAPVCNPFIIRTYPGGLGPIEAMVGTIRYGEILEDPFTGQFTTSGESLSSAVCQLNGQFDKYYDFETGGVYPNLEFTLRGSAACLKIN